MNKSQKFENEKPTILLNVYNAKNHLDAFFQSLKNQTYQNYKILVIDDGSTDSTVEKIDSFRRYFEIQLIKRQHMGLRKSRSYGINKIKSNLFLILDIDLILDKNAIEELLKPFNDNDVAAIGGMLKNSSKGCISESYNALRHIFFKIRIKNGQIDWVNGGFCAFRKKIIDEVSGFESSETSEDIDISWKIKERGYKIIVNEKAMSYHKDPETFRQIWIRDKNTGFREFELTKKHPKKSLTFKRIMRFYPLLTPFLLPTLAIFYWPLIVLISLLSFFMIFFIVKGKIKCKSIAWFTFNIMNFAYCTGFFSAFFKKID